MMPSLATIADMEARLGHTIDDTSERGRAQALLDDASSLVRFAADRTWVTTDDPPALADVPDVAVTITVVAALRGWFNPAGIESAQLGAVSVRYGGAWLTGAERDQLGLISRGQGLQQVLLQPGFGFERPMGGYVPVDNNGDGLSVPYADWFPLGFD